MNQETKVHAISPDTVICNICRHTFTPGHKLQLNVNLPRSQHPPSTIEASQTRALLEQEESEIQRYDEELRKLRIVMDKLESERRLLWRQVERRRSWLAPIRRLPTEVLEHILDLSRTGSYSLRIDGEDIQAPVHNLSRVCSYWRHLVFAQPKWWGQISLRIDGLKRNVVPFLELHFNKSQNQPLTIHVKDMLDCDWEDELLSQFMYTARVGSRGLRAFAVLMRQAGQMKRLTFSLPWTVFSGLTRREMNLLQDVTFSSLESFSCPGELHSDVPWFSRAITSHAPKLTVVALGCILRDSISSTQELPYSQLRSLTIQNVSLWLIENILQHCTALSHLSIQLEPSYWPPQLLDIFELPNLETLCFGYSQSTECTKFFKRIRLPALSSVIVVPGTYKFDSSIPVNWPCEAFLDMLQRSEADLKSISVQLPDSTLSGVDQMVQLLKMCHGLRKLDVQLKDSTNTLVEIFQRLVDSRHWYSRMTTLTTPPSDPVEGNGQLERLFNEICSGPDSDTA